MPNCNRFRRRQALALLTFTFALASAGPIRAASGATALPPADRAMARMAAVAQASQMAGEIALADAEGPIAERAFGLADREAARPHQVGERWMWASVSKQITAVLVMQEVQAGRLALDQAVSFVSPVSPVSQVSAAPTLQQLLQHRSGLPNPKETPEGVGGVQGFYLESGAGIGHQARAQGFCASAAARAPETQSFSYNNCDYLVLGALLERVSGQPYASLLHERLARPLQMGTLAIAEDGALRGGTSVVGYTQGGKRHPPLNVATFGAAGALTGSAHDLLRFDRALMAGRLLDPTHLALLWKGDLNLGYQALGAWSFPAALKGCSAPVPLVERRGDLGGIQVRNVMAPTLGRAVVIFVNDDTTDFGEIWQGRGLAFDLLSAAFCPAEPA